LVFFFIVFYFIFSLPWSVFFFFFHCWLPILSSPVDNLLLIYIFLSWFPTGTQILRHGRPGGNQKRRGEIRDENLSGILDFIFSDATSRVKLNAHLYSARYYMIWVGFSMYRGDLCECGSNEYPPFPPLERERDSLPLAAYNRNNKNE
jgi:hypothetical protein